MKVWMLFGSLTYFLIVVIFGYSLSNNIEGNIEYMIFWMLYIATILTLSILASSFFMSLTLKDLKGIPGERGEIGDSGGRGETGECEINCRDKIGYNIIINAIKDRLKEFEAMKSGKTPLSPLKRKINDHIRYYDNMNLTSDEILEKLKTKYKVELKPNNKDNKEVKVYINKSYISKVLSDDIIEKFDFELNNSYIKEKVKTILDSDEFRDMAAYRGPLKLIEYVKDLWLEWVELIYNASNLKYFTTVGAENDFEWVKDNPFNEIKKYDVFNWGLSNKTRPRVINVKEKYKKKVELGKEAFEDYTNLKNPKVVGRAHPDNKARLKIMRTNNYYFTYDDRDTTMMEQIRSYRPYSQFHNGDRYYPLGDVVVGPSKDNADDGDELIFSDSYDNKKKTIKKKGKTEGPNRDTILVAGDVKKPTRYETIWYDLQKKMARHWTCRMCKKQPRSSYYRGIAHHPICPTGYTSLGDIYTSQDNQTEELKKRTNKHGSYEPILKNHPVCIPTNCVEVIEEKDPQIIWDTYRSQRPAHGSGSSNWFKYVVDNAQIYSLTPNTGKKGFVKATHENSYNLSKLWLEDSKTKKHKLVTEWASKDSHLKDDYLKNLEEQEKDQEEKLLKEQEQEQEQEQNEARENFQGVELLIMGIIALAKGLEKPLMLRPYMYRIKDECIIKDDGNINLNGDDYKWPSILKEDKTGYPGNKKQHKPAEDATIFFIPENEEEQIIESIPKHIDSKVGTALVELKKLEIYLNDIDKLNKFFEKNNFYRKYHIDTIEKNNIMLYEILEDQTYEYKDEDYSYFYFITEYISFLSSLPSLNRYNTIKEQRDRIHTVYRKIIDPINEEKLNNLKLKLGLGWKGMPRFDTKGKDYSMHHFFYIDNEGYCIHITSDNTLSIKLKFKKVINPDIYTLKIEKSTIHDYLNKYLGISNNDITQNLIKKTYLSDKDESNDYDINNFYFKLKLTGNKTDEIIIKPYSDVYKDYLLTYNNNNDKFKFILKKDIKANNDYKFEIKYYN